MPEQLKIGVIHNSWALGEIALMMEGIVPDALIPVMPNLPPPSVSSIVRSLNSPSCHNGAGNARSASTDGEYFDGVA